MIEGDESSCRDALDRLFFACLQYLILREDASLVVNELVREGAASLCLVVGGVDVDAVTTQASSSAIIHALERDGQVFPVSCVSPWVIHTGQARARHRQKRR